MSDLPRFLEWREADLAAWRKASPVSEDFVTYLQWERNRALEALFAAVKSGRDRDAHMVAGGIETLDAIALLLDRKDPPAEQDVSDEEFLDPATRPSVIKERLNALRNPAGGHAADRGPQDPSDPGS